MATMKSTLRGALALLFLSWPVAGRADTLEYFHVDALGSVRAVTSTPLPGQQPQIIERHDYYPFGEECTTGPCASNPGVGAGQPRKFTGKERDQETGLDYFGARYYSSKVGRFTTVDPYYNWSENLVDPQRWNRYAYGLNNPFRYIDTNGKWPTKVKTVHQNAVDRALPFLPVEDRETLKVQQLVADENQTTEGSFMHAMRGSGQKAEEARDLANQYVRTEIEQAQLFERLGAHTSALTHLGNAMHVLQDATSPQHEGFQEWNGSWGKTSSQVRRHVKGEFYDPGKGSDLDRATSRAYEYFTGSRAMPKDFFENIK